MNAQTLPLQYYFKRLGRLEIPPKKYENTAEILLDKDWKINKFSDLILKFSSSSHQNIYNFNRGC
jgi:hypothetical protein